MRFAALIGAGLLAFSPVPALAQGAGLATALASGQVGERFDGFLGYVRPPTAGVRSATERVNISRRQLYANFAHQHGVSPYEVGITAGCTLLRRVPAGGAYLLQDNVWRRRQPGEGAPVPSYCAAG